MVISVSLVVQTLVLLVLGVACLMRPETIQRLALEGSRTWGRANPWRYWMLTREFIGLIRLCGGMLVFMAALLAFALVM